MPSTPPERPHRPTPLRVRHDLDSPLGRISQAGRLEKHPGSPGARGRVLGQYAVVYLYDGSGFFEDERTPRRTVTAGDLLVLFPDIPHSYGPVDRRWREIYLVFSGPVFDLWRQRGLFTPSRPVWRLEPIDPWLHRFESVLGASARHGWSPPLLDVCRLQQVLAEAQVASGAGEDGKPTGRQASPVPGGSEAAWASEACMLLEVDLKQARPLEAIASEMHMSYPAFRRRFTRIVGLPPGRYRATRAIDRAAEMMQHTTLTDEQIAAELGFCDPGHFSRRFRQITGERPRTFRRRLP